MKKGKWDSSSDEERKSTQQLQVANKKSKSNGGNEESTANKRTLSDYQLVDSSTSGRFSHENGSDNKQYSGSSGHHVQALERPDSGLSVVLNTSKEVQIKSLSTNIIDEGPCEPVRKHNPLFHGCRSIDEYERVSYISQGTYGVVFRARCKITNKIYAIKQVKLGPDANKVGFPISALREANILLSLSHKNIIRVTEMVVGSTTDKVFMVMDYYDNDLRYCMDQSKQPFSTAEVKQLMMQLLHAVEHMHRHWYIHRDLKTTNLLYSNRGDLVVCDFGMARKYDSPIAPYTKEVVTLWYRAPELLLGSTTYTTALDMWSVGCIFGEMLTGKPLLPGEGEVDQIARIFKLIGAPSEERWPGFSKLPNTSHISVRMPARGKLREVFPVTSFSGSVFLNDTGFDLLSRILHMDPRQRLTASAALSHPWLNTEPPNATPKDLMPTFSSRHDRTAADTAT